MFGQISTGFITFLVLYLMTLTAPSLLWYVCFQLPYHNKQILSGYVNHCFLNYLEHCHICFNTVI